MAAADAGRIFWKRVSSTPVSGTVRIYRKIRRPIKILVYCLSLGTFAA